MKYSIAYTISFTVLLLMGCQDNPFSTIIDAELPEFEERIVVHGFLLNTDTVLRLGLSKTFPLLSKEAELIPINDALVSLYKDGDKLFDFEPDSENVIQNYFHNNETPFVLDDGLYELLVSVSGFSEISATSHFPEFVPIANITFEGDDYISSQGRIFESLEITFRDPPGVGNFYELSIAEVDENCVGQIEKVRYVESNDINVLKSGSNTSILISDAIFDGETYTIRLGIDKIISNGHNLKASWKSLTKEQFEYSRSLFNFGSQQNFGDFSQPISIFSNIENGVGFFGCAAHQLYNLSDFQDFASQTFSANFLNQDNFNPCAFQASNNNNNRIQVLAQNENGNSLTLLIPSPMTGFVDGVVGYVDEISGTDYLYRNSNTQLEITTFDADKQIIAGSFEGVLYNQARADSIEISLLEFDLNYLNQ